ncbi:MAG: FeoB-associated Cys-rich membrane protein [Ruminococcus sp.]|jgi:hypothetical protein|nr:FeoB-associated Cys-rich membrane protein [Ruminococcus sp.]
MNISDILLSGAIILSVILAVKSIIKQKRSGKSCCGNCSGCTMNCKTASHE